MWSYVFENKENKQTDSKATKNKDGKVESVSKDRVIARLQVFFTFYLEVILIVPAGALCGQFDFFIKKKRKKRYRRLWWSLIKEISFMQYNFVIFVF